ncbi:hypothetical protein WK53_00680 [Burkholderia ubonensis]|uniref:Uncharacterized protein n=1 Tax=Burkholderia ubonensis TaxID=101571 RepID=A0AAW3N9L2_9BURK|nr:hypothetical protein WK53_00680 [Burkholderia ubonensis]
MAARAGLTGRESRRTNNKGDDRVVIALFAAVAWLPVSPRYCGLAEPDAGAGATAPLDSSGDSVSGVPDVSGMLSDDDAVSSVGLTSDGGAPRCWSTGFGGRGGTVGK